MPIPRGLEKLGRLLARVAGAGLRPRRHLLGDHRGTHHDGSRLYWRPHGLAFRAPSEESDAHRVQLQLRRFCPHTHCDQQHCGVLRLSMETRTTTCKGAARFGHSLYIIDQPPPPAADTLVFSVWALLRFVPCSPSRDPWRAPTSAMANVTCPASQEATAAFHGCDMSSQRSQWSCPKHSTTSEKVEATDDAQRAQKTEGPVQWRCKGDAVYRARSRGSVSLCQNRHFAACRGAGSRRVCAADGGFVRTS